LKVETLGTLGNLICSYSYIKKKKKNLYIDDMAKKKGLKSKKTRNYLKQHEASQKMVIYAIFQVI
jgi:hypothetical protein